MSRLRIPYWYLLLGPSLMFGIGFFLNAFVMALNHGQMPVLMPDACSFGNVVNGQFPGDWVHVCMNHATHLKFLADWIVINGMGIASPGDFFEWAWEYSYLPSLLIWATLMVRDHGKNDPAPKFREW